MQSTKMAYNKAREAEYNQEYYKRPEVIAKRTSPDGRAAAVQATKMYKSNLRIRVLDYLGGKCDKCGFSDSRALQVDHVNGRGAAERRKTDAYSIYLAVLRGKPGYQLLCANCNWIKRVENNEVRRKRMTADVKKDQPLDWSMFEGEH